jgi:hypothetical protein
MHIVGLLNNTGCNKPFLENYSQSSIYISESSSENFNSKFINIENDGGLE